MIGKIYVGSIGELRQQLISTFHVSPMGGHSGQLVIFNRLALLFYWSNIKKMVVQHNERCDIFTGIRIKI